MAVEIHIEGDQLALNVQGWHKLFAMKMSMHIPLAHIQGIRHDPSVTKGWSEGIRIIGTGLGDYLRAGSFMGKGGLVFWDVHDHDKAVIVDLHDEEYKQLIVEVQDPQKTIAEVEAAIKKG